MDQTLAVIRTALNNLEGRLNSLNRALRRMHPSDPKCPRFIALISERKELRGKVTVLHRTIQDLREREPDEELVQEMREAAGRGVAAAR